MNEIRLIFNEVFKDYKEDSKYLWFILAENNKAKRILFGTIILSITLILLTSLEALLKNDYVVNVVLAFLSIALILLIADLSLTIYFKKLINDSLNQKVQNEFIPKLNQEQIKLLVKKRAEKILKEGKGNLSQNQKIGLEDLSHSLTHKNITEIIKVNVLTNIKGEESERN